MRITVRAGEQKIAFDATIKEYLREIDEAELLDWQQEKDLANRIINDNDPEARDELVKSNLRLVVNIAKSFSSPNMTFGDLIEEGNLGLLRAVDSFDPEHGVRFSTYASWWIRQSIKRSMLANSQMIHIPTYMVELVNHFRYVASQLKARYERPARLEEVAKEMKIPIKKARAIQGIIDTVSSGHFRGAGDGDDESSLSETIRDDKAALPEDAIGNSEHLARAVQQLEQIDERQAQVIKLRFGLDGQEPLTLKEIGQKMDLTRERVRQIQREALDNLHELMELD